MSSNAISARLQGFQISNHWNIGRLYKHHVTAQVGSASAVQQRCLDVRVQTTAGGCNKLQYMSNNILPCLKKLMQLTPTSKPQIKGTKTALSKHWRCWGWWLQISVYSISILDTPTGQLGLSQAMIRFIWSRNSMGQQKIPQSYLPLCLHKYDRLKLICQPLCSYSPKELLTL